LLSRIIKGKKKRNDLAKEIKCRVWKDCENRGGAHQNNGRGSKASLGERKKIRGHGEVASKSVLFVKPSR